MGNDTKAWYTSKTIWFNVLSGLIGIIGTLASDKGLPPNVTAIFTTVVAIGNIALRFISSSEVTVTKQ